MRHTRSEAIFNASAQYIPGGVNSPVRSFGAVGMPPIVASAGCGSRLFDEDGNEYIDYICSWGPLIFGHSPDFLKQTYTEALSYGVTFGLPTLPEYEMAKMIAQAYPAAELVRMVNSGTEATMSAIRVARGHTGRNKLVKFAGCYHGHSDALLVMSGSGALTYAVPTSPGVPEEAARNTLVLPYNDIPAMERLFSQCGGEIACVIVEPIAGNMGLVLGHHAFLLRLRALCSEYGAVLIFDEVISGFRVAYGGACEHYGIAPDMVCFGKIIGAGLPVGAYGGKREIMQCVSPLGPVYQAGTLSGNPLAMRLGVKALQRLRDEPELYEALDIKGKALISGIRANLKSLGLPYQTAQLGSLACLFFTQQEIRGYDDVKRCDTKQYQRYFQKMLDLGILLPPSQFECMFLSLAHTDEDIERTVRANYEALKEL